MDSNQAEMEVLCSEMEHNVQEHDFPRPLIQIESDSMEVISWNNRLGKLPWKYHTRMAKCWDLMNHNSAVAIKHIPREHNEFADFLAKRGDRSQGDFYVWF